MSKPFKTYRKRMIDGKTVTMESKTYYGKVKDQNGVWKTIKLFRNKEASVHELNRLTRDSEKIRAGMIEPTISEGLTTPLIAHIDDYAEAVRENSKKSSSQWWNEQKAKLKLVFNQAKVVMVRDINPEKIKGALGDLSRKQCWSKRTRNHYIRAIKAFFSWLHKEKKIGFNPIENLKVDKVRDSDIKRPRRAFSAVECQFLINYLVHSKDDRKVVNPPKERALLYALAFQSGLRAKELCSLKPLNFDFEGGTVTILGKDSKNASTEVVPLPSALVEQIKQHTLGKDKSKAIFKGVYSSSVCGRRLKKDMAKARKSYIQESRTPEEKEARTNDDFLLFKNHLGEYLDFQSLRSGFVTSLLEQGANIKVVQKLARHKDAETTLKHYAKVRNMQELTKVVATMPALLVNLCDQNVDHGDQKVDQITDISGCELISNDSQSNNLSITHSQWMQSLMAIFTEEEYMRPVRFELTALGLGNRCSIP